MATDMTASGSPEEKLRWAFKMYDKDGSGKQINRFLTCGTFLLWRPQKLLRNVQTGPKWTIVS